MQPAPPGTGSRFVVATVVTLEDRLGHEPGVPSAPLGVQHAVPAANPTRALCGLDATGWHVFPGLPFESATEAACLRCAQLTGGLERRRLPVPTSQP